MSYPTEHDPLLEGMVRVAVPLDEWCDLCEMKLAVGSSHDGVKACGDCMKEVLAALQKYEDDAKFLATKTLHRSTARPGAAKARAKRRAKRKRTKR